VPCDGLSIQLVLKRSQHSCKWTESQDVYSSTTASPVLLHLSSA